MLKSRRFWIGLAITLLFLFLFLYQTDFAEMGRALVGANYAFLLPAVLVYFGGVFLRSVRWHCLLRPLKAIASLRLFPLVVIGFLVNDILPARLGIVARAYILGEREGMSKMSTAGTIVVEQVFDGVTLLLFIAFISLFVPLADWLRGAVYILAGLFVGSLIICFVIALSETLTRGATSGLARLSPRRLRGRLEEWLVLFIDGLKVMRSPRRLLLVLLLSVAVWLCEGVMAYILSFSFGLGQPFYVMLLAASIANLALTLPTSPGGIGPFDYFFKGTLVLFGTSGAVATAYVSALHLTLLVPVILLGLVFLWTENISLAKMVPARRKGLAASYQGDDALEDEE